MQGNGIEYQEQVFLAIYKDGELAAIEYKNGTLKRWIVKEADLGDTLELFDIPTARR